MPIYEFRCLACSHVFEILSLAQDDTGVLKCPQCQATEAERVLSRASYVMTDGSGSGPKSSVTTKSCSGGSCTTIDIPGPSR
jgi:putative FmdB family regulatory protein